MATASAKSRLSNAKFHRNAGGRRIGACPGRYRPGVASAHRPVSDRVGAFSGVVHFAYRSKALIDLSHTSSRWAWTSVSNKPRADWL